jgi:hypothetical protein
MDGTTFSFCSSFTTFTVAASHTAYAAQDGILYNKAKTTIFFVPYAISGAVTLPDTLTSIESYVFSSCSSLTSVTIPAGVTSIGNGAFSYCSELASVTVLRDTEPLTTLWSSAFASTSSSLVIQVPSATVEAYKVWSGWSVYADQIEAIGE